MIVVTVAQPSIVVVPLGMGAPGPAGPDPWLDPVQHLTGNGPLTIDYVFGKHVVLTLEDDTELSVINWPISYHIARLTVEVHNTGDYALTLPSGVIWHQGQAVSNSKGSGKTDVFVFSTVDGGTTVFGHLIGLDFKTPV